MLAHGFRTEDLPTGHMCLPELPRFEDWPRLTEGLLAHGFAPDEVRGILGANWLAFMRRAGL
jgi:microsomal dipeptidase-like Zn-dependent dipeptidase